MKKASEIPTIVREKYEKLSEAKQELFYDEFLRKRKTKKMGFILAFLFGFHYIYVRKYGFQILFWVTGGGAFVWWFIDLFRVAGIIKKHNQEVALQAMRDVVTFD